jgi:hypothetical protein
MAFAPRIEFDPDADSWRENALCHRMHLPLSMFMSDKGRHDLVAKARRVCADCPVSAQCLEAGIWELVGVWGGTVPSERRVIRRIMRKRSLDLSSAYALFLSGNKIEDEPEHAPIYSFFDWLDRSRQSNSDRVS